MPPIYKSEKSRKNINPVVFLIVTKQANNGLDIDQISAWIYSHCHSCLLLSTALLSREDSDQATQTKTKKSGLASLWRSTIISLCTCILYSMSPCDTTVKTLTRMCLSGSWTTHCVHTNTKTHTCIQLLLPLSVFCLLLHSFQEGKVVLFTTD